MIFKFKTKLINLILFLSSALFFTPPASASCRVDWGSDSNDPINYFCKFYGDTQGTVPTGATPPPPSSSLYFFQISRQSSSTAIFDSRNEKNTELMIQSDFAHIPFKIEGKFHSGATVHRFYVLFNRSMLFSDNYRSYSIYIHYDPWAVLGYGTWKIESSSPTKAKFKVANGVMYDSNIISTISLNPIY